MSLSAAGARLESVPRYGSKWARMFFFTRSAYFISSFSSPPQQQLVARPLDGHAARQSFDDYKANVNYPRGLHNMGSDVIAQRQRRDFRRRLDLPRGIYCFPAATAVPAATAQRAPPIAGFANPIAGIAFTFGAMRLGVGTANVRSQIFFEQAPYFTFR